MKTGIRKLLNTFSDFSTVRDDPPSPSPSVRTEATSKSGSFGGFKSKKKQQEEIIRLLTDLGEERRRTLELHERLQKLLNQNTEMRATAAVQVDEERRLRRVAEIRMRETRARLAKAEKALSTAQLDKDTLEAELMEAASDVMAHHAVHKAYQEKIAGEKAAWQLLEQADDERVQLEKRLKASETQRMNLLKSMAALRSQSPQWGDVFDLLQASSDRSPPRVTSPDSGLRLPPIAENEKEGEAIDSAKADLKQLLKHKPEIASLTVADEISFIPPIRSSSPLSMIGSENAPSKPPLHPMTPEKTLQPPPGQDASMDTSDGSMSSHESIFVPEDDERISLGDYIMSREA